MKGDGRMVERREVLLRVPEDLDYQLVFRQERSDPVPLEERDGCELVMLTNPLAGLKYLSRLGGYPPGRYLRLLLRLARGNRIVCLLLRSGTIAVSACTWLGVSKHYWIDPGATVVGGLWTSPEHRGQGLGFYAFAKMVNAMIERGHHLLYVDTDRDNIASRHIIDHCGWGEPIALYIIGRKPPRG